MIICQQYLWLHRLMFNNKKEPTVELILLTVAVKLLICLWLTTRTPQMLIQIKSGGIPTPDLACVLKYPEVIISDLSQTCILLFDRR